MMLTLKFDVVVLLIVFSFIYFNNLIAWILALVGTGPIVPGREGHLSRLANRDRPGGTKGPTFSRGPVTSRDKWSSTWPGAQPLVAVRITGRD